MAKKRKKKRGKQAFNQLQGNYDVVRIVEYEITTEPIYDRHYKGLPDEVKEAISRLYYEAPTRPSKAIPEILGLIEQYPNIPILYNYLSVAYSAAGQTEKSEAAILENYRLNPDYLFARLNYAELCRIKGDYEQIAEIFEHKFDLKLLYPHRNRFHISEVANFMGLIGIYFIETDRREVAMRYFDMLKELAPDYPVVKLLRKKLYPNSFNRLLSNLAGRMSSD
jgi:tetratricopeptide (TPR) repeat protein